MPVAIARRVISIVNSPLRSALEIASLESDDRLRPLTLPLPAIA
jgi:hypothetical protein